MLNVLVQAAESLVCARIDAEQHNSNFSCQYISTYLILYSDILAHTRYFCASHTQHALCMQWLHDVQSSI
jgi:hypothetical protein